MLNRLITRQHYMRLRLLWDRLPDYCKTARLREKVKEMASPLLLSKLAFRA